MSDEPLGKDDLLRLLSTLDNQEMADNMASDMVEWTLVEWTLYGTGRVRERRQAMKKKLGLEPGYYKHPNANLRIQEVE